MITSVQLLSLLVFAAVFGMAQAQCINDPALCLTCADCNSVVRQSDQARTYLWVATDSSSSDPGPGICVQRYDPPTIGELRAFDKQPLCTKRLFLACNGGLTQSVVRSCSTSSASELKISSFITASLVAVLALNLMVN
jgi:hypothetical protein